MIKKQHKSGKLIDVEFTKLAGRGRPDRVPWDLDQAALQTLQIK